MNDSALECALALRRAPLMAPSMRSRPLPPDIGWAIDIAAGSTVEAARAAAMSGEEPGVLREAMRFYLQQVLLFPEADAYRVLGVAPDAPIEEIRGHHRSLQRWLHPDRSRNRWEAVYATRVNQAWTQLRTEQARARYDANLQVGAAGSLEPSGDAPRWRWRPVEVERVGWRVHPVIPVGLLLCACVLLGWQAVKRSIEVRPASSDVTGALGLQFSEGTLPALTEVEPLRPVVPDRGPLRTREKVAAEEPHDDSGLAPPAIAKPQLLRADRAEPVVRPVVAPVALMAARSRATPMSDAAPIETRASEMSDAGESVKAAPTVDVAMYARAQRRGAQLLAYLGDVREPIPPIWNSVDAMEGASAARNALTSDGKAPRTWQKPTWRLAGDRAELTAQVSGRRWRPVIARDQGTLHAVMQWREGDWRVDRVHWEPAR